MKKKETPKTRKVLIFEPSAIAPKPAKKKKKKKKCEKGVNTNISIPLNPIELFEFLQASIKVQKPNPSPTEPNDKSDKPKQQQKEKEKDESINVSNVESKKKDPNVLRKRIKKEMSKSLKLGLKKCFGDKDDVGITVVTGADKVELTFISQKHFQFSKVVDLICKFYFEKFRECNSIISLKKDVFYHYCSVFVTKFVMTAMVQKLEIFSIKISDLIKEKGIVLNKKEYDCEEYSSLFESYIGSVNPDEDYSHYYCTGSNIWMNFSLEITRHPLFSWKQIILLHFNDKKTSSFISYFHKLEKNLTSEGNITFKKNRDEREESDLSLKKLFRTCINFLTFFKEFRNKGGNDNSSRWMIDILFAGKGVREEEKFFEKSRKKSWFENKFTLCPICTIKIFKGHVSCSCENCKRIFRKQRKFSLLISRSIENQSRSNRSYQVLSFPSIETVRTCLCDYTSSKRLNSMCVVCEGKRRKCVECKKMLCCCSFGKLHLNMCQTCETYDRISKRDQKSDRGGRIRFKMSPPSFQ